MFAHDLQMLLEMTRRDAQLIRVRSGLGNLMVHQTERARRLPSLLVPGRLQITAQRRRNSLAPDVLDLLLDRGPKISATLRDTLKPGMSVPPELRFQCIPNLTVLYPLFGKVLLYPVQVFQSRCRSQSLLLCHG